MPRDTKIFCLLCGRPIRSCSCLEDAAARGIRRTLGIAPDGTTLEYVEMFTPPPRLSLEPETTSEIKLPERWK